MEKIILNSFLRLECEDHLHIRGENSPNTIRTYSISGSPPHTWRKCFEFSKFHQPWRITSTYVEKILGLQRLAYLYRDHLHIRGENTRSNSHVNVCSGSPPHTWRKFKRKTRSSGTKGITSTYVEKMNEPFRGFKKSWDHLHIRGENPIFLRCQLHDLGSPPHTWRKFVV